MCATAVMDDRIFLKKPISATEAHGKTRTGSKAPYNISTAHRPVSRQRFATWVHFRVLPRVSVANRVLGFTGRSAGA